MSYAALIERLSRHSVTKHFDAYADVEWDAPEMKIDPHDPRWERSETDPLGATSWYRGLPQPTRAQLGLHLVAHQMKVGIFFENILQRGLLEFAAALPNGAPEYRYAHHEVIEESQHSLMFQEFVNRTGLPVSGPSGLERFGARFVPALGRTFPELFFLFVLGGEEPIDYTQREALAARAVQHPLLQRIMRIHVTEEARHLCFARAFIEENVPKLGALRMLHLRVRTPFIFSIMAKQMLEPPQEIARAYLMPRSVVREAYSRNAEHRRAVMASLAKIRKLCFDLGIASPGFIELWRKLGIWPDAASAAPSGPKVNQGGQAGLAPPLTR